MEKKLQTKLAEPVKRGREATEELKERGFKGKKEARTNRASDLRRECLRSHPATTGRRLRGQKWSRAHSDKGYTTSEQNNSNIL